MTMRPAALLPPPLGAFAGLRLLINPLAVTRTVWHTVERIPGRHRKKCRVRHHERSDPSCYKIGGHTLVVHPEIAAVLARIAR